MITVNLAQAWAIEQGDARAVLRAMPEESKEVFRKP